MLQVVGGCDGFDAVGSCLQTTKQQPSTCAARIKPGQQHSPPASSPAASRSAACTNCSMSPRSRKSSSTAVFGFLSFLPSAAAAAAGRSLYPSQSVQDLVSIHPARDVCHGCAAEAFRRNLIVAVLCQLETLLPQAGLHNITYTLADRLILHLFACNHALQEPQECLARA